MRNMDLEDFYRRLHTQFTATLRSVDPHLAPALGAQKMAPFAADPALTLTPAPLMVVSMKPYAAAGRAYPFGWEEREAQPGLHRWYDGGKRSGNFVREADRLLREILHQLDLALTPRQIFNTYAYFYRATDARQLKAFGLQRVDCTAFHREFLSVIRPRLIVCIGNGPAPSAFASYAALLGAEEHEVRSVGPRVRIRTFRSDGCLVVGVPHLSYLRAEVLLPEIRAIIDQYYLADR